MGQRGNILFLILLAIILFVALTYAVNSGMRGGGNSASSEKYAATLAQMRNTAALLTQGIGRLRLTNDCKDTEISFEHPSFPAATGPYGAFNTTYANPNAPASLKCNLFDPAGGGISVPSPMPATSGITLNAVNYQVRTGVSFDNIGTSASEIFLLIGPVTDAFCNYINGTNNISGMSMITALGNSVPAKGDFSLTPRTYANANKDFYCFNNYSPTQNYYVEVLLQR